MIKKGRLFCLFFLLLKFVSAQVILSESGRVKEIKTDFSYSVYDGQFNRSLLKSGWDAKIGDYLTMMHSGANQDSETYGFRISDSYGFDLGKDNFKTIFLKVKTNGFVGIGTTNPTSNLEVNSEMKINNSNNRGSSFLKLDRGSEGRDVAAVAYGQDSNYKWFAGMLYSGGSLNSDYHISQNHNYRNPSGEVAHQPELTIKINGNIGIGTATPDSKLTVKGNIHAEEIKVDLSVPAPDYVFKKDYNLIPLEEVQQYINKEGHLPNIPSAKELEEKGVELGVMNMKLLEKIEELTLYILELKRENLEQRNEINSNKNLKEVLTEVKSQNILIMKRLKDIENK